MAAVTELWHVQGGGPLELCPQEGVTLHVFSAFLLSRRGGRGPRSVHGGGTVGDGSGAAGPWWLGLILAGIFAALVVLALVVRKRRKASSEKQPTLKGE